MSKIYTKTGDNGTTSTYKNQRVPKNADIIEAIGTIDELNAAIGLLLAQPTPQPVPQTIKDYLQQIQQELFLVGESILSDQNKMTEVHIKQIENHIDQSAINLSHFVIPGGTLFQAHCHQARTICRRAERKTVGFNKQALKYLNRLSDYLFCLSQLKI